MFCAKSCANIGSSEDDLCSARSTVAIRFSIRLPVNVISNVPFFFPDPALFCFSWPLRENSTTEFLQSLYPARLTITAPGARQFLRGKLNSYELKLFRRPASWRCATADCDQSRLLMPSPASSLANESACPWRPHALHP